MDWRIGRRKVEVGINNFIVNSNYQEKLINL